MLLFEKDLPKYLKKHGITRIQQVNKTYLDDVFALFNKRLLDGKTLKETTAEVFKVMKAPRFYKYQAERIARTETTAAANYGAVQSGAVSGYVMNKRWISALDKRTRTFSDGNYDHAQKNSKIVGEKEPFRGGEKNIDLYLNSGQPIVVLVHKKDSTINFYGYNGMINIEELQKGAKYIKNETNLLNE